QLAEPPHRRGRVRAERGARGRGRARAGADARAAPPLAALRAQCGDRGGGGGARRDHVPAVRAAQPGQGVLGGRAVGGGVAGGRAVVGSLVSVATFDFFFVPPRFTFVVSDTQYLVTFSVMLLAAMLIGTLAARLQAQVQAARVDEHRSDALAKLSRELVALQDRERILAAVLRHLEDVFESRGVVLLPDARGRLTVAAGADSLLGADGP